MIAFAPAKINIGLRIVNKRTDGFHNLESYLYPVPLYDLIEILPSVEDEFVQTGLDTQTSISNNIVFKAVLLMRETVKIPPVKIHLHKQIPVKSGLGGGSSDAVSTLKLLNELFSLNSSSVDMQQYAEALGSDCPFFLKSTAAKITGRGEHIMPVDFSLAGKYIVIIKPDFSISTAKAFSDIKTFNINSLPNLKGEQLTIFTNDFENSMDKEQIWIQEIKDFLIANGAVYTSMSGSGSAVFGIFKDEINISFNAAYFHWIGRLQ